MTSKSDLYRKLPSVDELLRSPELRHVVERDGPTATADAARAILSRLRDEIAAERLDTGGIDLALSGISDAIDRQLSQMLGYSLWPVINATGVVLHTNLGRAPLAESTLAHVGDIASQYSNLEFDLDTGERGKRDNHVDRLFHRLLAGVAGEISTIVVNNNAAAVLLALNTLAEGGEVVVSRGELVEIGGSFRIPEIMAKSNAILKEVGTTNRTRIADYERAISDKTRALLRVHRSNFEITGFTEQPRLEDLVELGHKCNLPLIEDLGSGALLGPGMLAVSEPGVLDSLRTGVDVVTYSGDKLLGGPQAGIASGRSGLIAKMRANALFRALRVDKMTYAALEATLLAYIKHDHDAIPALRMMRLSKDEIGARAEAIAARTRSPQLTVEIIDGESLIGGGAAPSAVLPTRLLAVGCEGRSADQLAAQLRACNPPIIARVEEGRLLLDLRTVFPEQDGLIADALRHLATSS